MKLIKISRKSRNKTSIWGCDAQATNVVASPKMTKNDDFWGILQKFHRNRDAIRLGISPGKFLMRRAPQAGQRVWVRHPILLQEDAHPYQELPRGSLKHLEGALFPPWIMGRKSKTA